MDKGEKTPANLDAAKLALAEQVVAVDRLLFGVGLALVNEDGSIERIDPRDFYCMLPSITI